MNGLNKIGTSKMISYLEGRIFMMENKIDFLKEQIECLHLCLDKEKVPREKNGKEYSLWGRVLIFSEMRKE